MSEQKPVFLNGSPFWYPLLGSVTSLATLGITHSIGGLPFALQCITELAFVANLSMLMSCWSACGRWLGRTKYPDMCVILSGLVSVIDLGNRIISDAPITPSLLMLALGTIILSMASMMVFATLFNASYYLEDSEGNMVCKPESSVVNSNDMHAETVWKRFLRSKRIRSGYKLMQRKLFGPSLVRVVEGLEWRALHVDDIGKFDMSVVVFGHDIVSARQSAAYIMMVDPELIVISPKGSHFVELAETIKQQRLKKKADVAELQNQIYPDNSSLLTEDHATRMDHLFTQAINSPKLSLTEMDKLGIRLQD
jgi:hypothetical protein